MPHITTYDMNPQLKHVTLNIVTLCVLFPAVWSYRSSDSSNHYGHREYWTVHEAYQRITSNKFFNCPEVPFGSSDFGSENNGPSCPQPRPFSPNAEKVVDNSVAYECLPSYVRNSNAVLDDDDGTTVWAGGQKPDYSSVNALFDRGEMDHWCASVVMFAKPLFFSPYNRTDDSASKGLNGG